MFPMVLLAPLWAALYGSQAAAQTRTFLDRQLPTDLRVVSYNVYWNTIFPSRNSTQAAKFERVVDALDPDILHLQEISTSQTSVLDLMNTIAPLAGGTWYTHQGGDNVIVSKYPLAMMQTNTTPSGERSQAIALVDLPDGIYATDFYFMNNHYRCCGDEANDPSRQRQSDAIVNWLRDARSPGESVDLPPGTPFAVVGDLNIVGGPQPLQTLIDGNIIDEATYGTDSPPDWDGSQLTDARPLHNVVEPEDYTWRNDHDIYDPGRLDFVIYSDSALDVGNQFVLNTVAMSPAELSATGLQQFDITLDDDGENYDHLPLVVDFRLFTFAPSDFNFSRSVDAMDLEVWNAGYGMSSASRSQGDADGNGDVDGRDFLLWQQQHMGPPPLATPVPEPATFALMIACAIFSRRFSKFQ